MAFAIAMRPPRSTELGRRGWRWRCGALSRSSHGSVFASVALLGHGTVTGPCRLVTRVTVRRASQSGRHQSPRRLQFRPGNNQPGTSECLPHPGRVIRVQPDRPRSIRVVRPIPHIQKLSAGSPSASSTSCSANSRSWYVTHSHGTCATVLPLTRYFTGISTSSTQTAWSGDSHRSVCGRPGPSAPAATRTGQTFHGC